jgi:5'-methylthioadenosine phosphorylase
MPIPLREEASEHGVKIGIIGGSGFYELIDNPVELRIETPYGGSSAPLSIGELAGQRVAFLPRHGRHHEYAPHRVPYQANIWSMAALGVTSLIAPCSCGSLQPDVNPGDFVVVDQLIDRTWGRPDTFHDVGGPAGSPALDDGVHHQTFADPYDHEIRTLLLDACRHEGLTTHDGGTMVVINGPRFSTRAESAWFRTMGWTVVNMTGSPEAVLAAEAGLRYATVGLVTDYDAGVDGHEPVTMEAVLEVMRLNIERIRSVLTRVVPAIT